MKKKILVVDDSLTVRNEITKMLNNSGFETIEAANGIEAISQIKQHPELDLVTLDLEMKDFDGFATLNTIRNDQNHSIPNRHIPVIIVTSKDTYEHRKKGFKLGASNFIDKAHMKQKLLPAVNKFIYPNAKFGDNNVLVIDDSTLARSMISQMLQELGVKTFLASTAYAAFEILRKEKIDLIISDLILTDLDGEKLITQIKEDDFLNHIPIIVVSMLHQQDELITLFNAGITDYINKPFIKEEFLARIAAHIKAHHSQTKLKEHIIELQKANERLKKHQDLIIKLEKKNSAMVKASSSNQAINQPLMVLQGNLDVLKLNSVGLNPQQMLAIEKISNSLDAINKILHKNESEPNFITQRPEL